jgi:hypothetical protein
MATKTDTVSCKQCNKPLERGPDFKVTSHGYQKKVEMARSHILHPGDCRGRWIKAVLDNDGVCTICPDRISIDDINGRPVKFEKSEGKRGDESTSASGSAQPIDFTKITHAREDFEEFAPEEEGEIERPDDFTTTDD